MDLTRRSFFTRIATAAGAALFLPDWLLEIPKGRSMIAVPHNLAFQSKEGIHILTAQGLNKTLGELWLKGGQLEYVFCDEHARENFMTIGLGQF